MKKISAGTVLSDPEIPLLARALDRVEAERELQRCLISYYGKSLSAYVQQIQVRDYEPGNYYWLQYTVRVEGIDFSDSITLVGKLAARGLDTSGFTVFRSLWKAGFHTSSAVSIPEPVGIVPALQIWLQKTVPGFVLADRIHEANDLQLAEKVAGALHQLQRIVIPGLGLHGPLDELHSIQRRILFLSQSLPNLELALSRLQRHCEQAVPLIPRDKPRSIHRDFDLNHIILDGPHLYLIGFERYCKSDPAFDAGNFLSSLLLLKLKSERAQASVLDQFAERFTEEFIRLSGPWTRLPVEIFAALRLVQNIYFGYQKGEDPAFLEELIDIADTRLRRLLHLRTFVA